MYSIPIKGSILISGVILYSFWTMHSVLIKGSVLISEVVLHTIPCRIYIVYYDVCPLTPCRDALIEQLMREIVELKEKISELHAQRDADRELMAGLRDRLQQMETELNDYKEIAEQTCNVSQSTCYNTCSGSLWPHDEKRVWQTAGRKHNEMRSLKWINDYEYH